MLTEIRKFKKTFTGLMIAGFCGLLMVGFGLNARGAYKQRQDNLVIKVNGHEIQYDEYYRQLSNLNESYRRQFGPNYSQLKRFLNLEQQTVDSIIEDRVSGDFLESLGLFSSTQQIESFIMQLPYFQQRGLSRTTYETFLREQGLTEKGLEEKLRQELEERQLNALLADLNRPTSAELKSVFLEQNTKAEFAYVSFKPKDFEGKVVTSDAEKLKSYYEGYSDRYRKPRSVNYKYVVFQPSEFLDKVEVSEDDLRERYAQKQSLYYEPKELKLREIIFNKAAEKPSAVEAMVGADDKDKAKENESKKATAKSLVERLRNGEDFQALAKQYSENKESGANGGDMGWMVTSKLPKDVRSVAERVEAGKYSDVIETPEQYVIVFIDEVKERKLKPFEAVRPELERDMRQADAPEYARVEAENFYQRWVENESTRTMSLDEFAAKEKREVKSAGKLLAKGEDPSDAPGLTEKIVQLSVDDKQSVHAGSQDYVIQITEAKDSYVPALDEIKDAVTKDFVTTESKLLAKHAADAALADLNGTAKAQGASEPAPKKTFEQVAQDNSLEIRTTAAATRSESTTDPLLQIPDAKRIAFGLTDANPVAPQVIPGNDEFFVVKLKARTLPNPEEFAAKEKSVAETEKQAAAKRFASFVVQSLRTSADVWVNPKVLEKNQPSADL